MSIYLTVTPGYGRDYKSAKEVRAAWIAGKDFTIRNAFSADDGRQINRQDADASGVTVNIRYRNLTHICVIKPNAKPPTPRKPRTPREPAVCCAEHSCTTSTRNKSGYCTRHNTDIWRQIRRDRSVAANVSDALSLDALRKVKPGGFWR